jgi:transcription initiation factor TFIIIB Brf1 subunit/transcription initiation factor TFIIB
MGERLDDEVLEEMKRTCSGLGVEETDVENAARKLYGAYEVKRPVDTFAVACVAIAMQEYNNDIPLEFVVTASSVDDIEQVRMLKSHIEQVLGLTYQSGSTDA